jgi:hypothetical protein
MTTAAQDEALIAKGWAALPPSYRIPDVAPTLDEARAWCRRLAESHYENFHVASWFLPPALHPHFHSIYAYCRISDDLGDEVPDRSAALALLNLWGQELDACYEGRARHPVFVALAETIRVPSPKSPSPTCSSPSARTRPLRVLKPCKTSSPTAATPPTR